jgi:hypothetical protein
MSHFTVLVIGPNPEDQLAPFHEFECTGHDDQYVEDVDQTEEARDGYKGNMETMLVRTSDGERFKLYAEQFHREPTEEELECGGHGSGKLIGTGSSRRKDGSHFSFQSQDWGDGKGHRGKVHYIPEGYEKQEVPIEEIQSEAEWIIGYHGGAILKPGEEKTEEHKYGFTEVDEDGNVVRVIRRTNPNKRWDWYVIGGRWCGFFPLKEGAEGVAGKGAGAAHGLQPEPETADQLRKGDVDFEKARDEAEKKGREHFAKWRALFEKHGKPELSWVDTRKRIEDEIAELKEKGIRDEMVPNPDPNENHELNREGRARTTWRARYNEQPAIAAYREVDPWTSPVEDFGFDEETYAQKCRNGALTPYAIVKDGKWYGKGEMGWWGISHDDKSDEKWNEEMARLYDDLSPDTLLTLFDCHI